MSGAGTAGTRLLHGSGRRVPERPRARFFFFLRHYKDERAPLLQTLGKDAPELEDARRRLARAVRGSRAGVEEVLSTAFAELGEVVSGRLEQEANRIADVRCGVGEPSAVDRVADPLSSLPAQDSASYTLPQHREVLHDIGRLREKVQEQPVLLERGLFQLDCTSFLRDLQGRLDGMTQAVMRAIEARIMEDCAKLKAMYEGATGDLVPPRKQPAGGGGGEAAAGEGKEGKEGEGDSERLAELAEALAKREEEMKRVEEELSHKQDGYRELAMFVFSEPGYVMSAKATQVLTSTLCTGAEARESMKRASVRGRVTPWVSRRPLEPC